MKKRLVLALTCLMVFSALSAQNQNISNGNVFEGEPFIAINPANPQNIVVAWMGFVPANGVRLSIKIRASFNGGQTWSSPYRVPHVVSTYKSADPSMVFDVQGNLFLSYIDYRESPDSGGVYLVKSVDGGINWSAPLLLLDAYADGSKRPIDRPWLSINAAGDKIFLTTKPAPWVPAPNRPYFTCSLDAGQSWTPWRYLDGPGNLVGNLIQAPMAAPAVAGEVFYAAFPSYVPTQNIFPQFILAITANGGGSVNYRSILSANQTASNDTAKLAYKLLADPVDAKHLVFIYPYQPFGDIDVMMTETFDEGLHWTTPLRINDDAAGNGKMQDMIWASFNQNGDLAIAWRDRRGVAGSGYATASGYYAAYRKKGAPLFQPNFPLSDMPVAYQSVLAQNGNDFMGIALNNDTLLAVWSNTRDGSLDVWFTKVLATTGQVTSMSQLEANDNEVLLLPNPTLDQVQIELRDQSTIQSIRVYDGNGALVRIHAGGGPRAVLHLAALPAGVYWLQIQVDNHMINKKLVKK